MMSTVIFLIVVTLSPHAPAVVVREMPNMQMCESIGTAIERARPQRFFWTCIEGAQ